MDRFAQIYKGRFYEGEHVFACDLCGTTYVEYSFGAEPNEFFDKQQPPVCQACGVHMNWAGWSGQSDITEGIVALVEDGHLMAATIVIAAFVEYQIDSLLWASLVDSGLPKEKASSIANGSLSRTEALRMIRSILARKVSDVAFPIRNEVAHGRAFGRPPAEFVAALDWQFSQIRAWVQSVVGADTPRAYNFREIDRWMLSMGHWIHWIDQWWANAQKKSLQNSGSP